MVIYGYYMPFDNGGFYGLWYLHGVLKTIPWGNGGVNVYENAYKTLFVILVSFTCKCDKI